MAKRTPKGTSIKDRLEFHSMPVPECGCQIWLGAINPSGYGIFSVTGSRRRVVNAHRIAWEVAIGPIPKGQHVLHRCDTRCCINPDHLFLGSHTENMRDMGAKNRSPYGVRHHNAKLSSKQVAAIRSSTRTGREEAMIYGVSESAISKIRSGVTRRRDQ